MTILRRFEAVALLLIAGLATGCSSEVKIGAVISKTGAVAPYGHQVTRGIDLALEQANAEGGFNGAPIQVIYRDDATNPEKGREAILDLINNEDVEMVIGAISSPVTLEIAPICEKERVILLSPTSSAPSISEAGEYIFRNYPSDILEGTAMADFAKERGVRRVAILALDNEFGAGLTEVFTRRFQSKSRKVVKTFRIDETKTPAYAEMIAELKELEPQGIYLVAYVEVLAELLQQIRAAGMDCLLMASGSVTEQLSQLAGEAAENLVYPQPSFDPNTNEPVVKKFVEAFRAKYDREPDIYAAHGYDSLNLLVQAMRKTGFTFPDEIRRGLHGLDNYVGAAGRTQFDERGDVVRYPKIFVIRDGQPVSHEQFEQEGGELPTPGRKST
jgi:branched-chain amino acid transport system substrate-binding protein